jgi:hypothetical protein
MDPLIVEHIASGSQKADDYRTLARLFPSELENPLFERLILKRDPDSTSFFDDPLLVRSRTKYDSLRFDRYTLKNTKFTRFFGTNSQGKLIPGSEGKYVDGLKDGMWVHRYSNGIKREEALYEHGERNGLTIGYSANGKKERDIMYKKGERVWTSEYE